MTELWLPKRRVRFLLLLSAAAVLLYFVGEVRVGWSQTVLAVSAMLVLHSAQAKPDFQPFRWWALLMLPVAAFTSSILGVPSGCRAAITSISFGLVLLGSAVVGLVQLRRRVELS